MNEHVKNVGTVMEEKHDCIHCPSSIRQNALSRSEMKLVGVNDGFKVLGGSSNEGIYQSPNGNSKVPLSGYYKIRVMNKKINEKIMYRFYMKNIRWELIISKKEKYK